MLLTFRYQSPYCVREQIANTLERVFLMEGQFELLQRLQAVPSEISYLSNSFQKFGRWGAYLNEQ